MSNRRNYYRILHVQPGAPGAVIRASYRTLMQRLRGHPDLGGDHCSAAAINEAYGVLSDPLKRARYDRELYSRLEQMRGEAPTAGPQKPGIGFGHCLFCRAPIHSRPRRAGGLLCPSCASPLVRPATYRSAGPDRRAVERLTHQQSMRLYRNPPQPLAERIRCCDVSLDGLSFLTHTALLPKAVLRIEGSLCTALIEVVHVRRAAAGEAGHWLVGARFLSVAFTRRRGGFLSESA